MAEVETVSIWYDGAGDYLEVLFAHKKGYVRETGNDAVMEKVDESGRVIGFSILKIQELRGESPLAVTLKSD